MERVYFYKSNHSREERQFEYESAFRSWLVRVLIDEALAILRETQSEKDPTDAVENVGSLSGSTQ